MTQLRRELSETMTEKSELQNIVSLNEDQVISFPLPNLTLYLQITLLKSTIRELESSLSRERELNASRPIDTEYLTNILRSFLLSKSPSEQAKLVSVLCSILHFQSEDTTKICEIWAARVKPTPGIGSGGLIGWFLPPTGVGEKGGTGGSGVDYQQYTDGIGGLDIY